MPLVAPRALHGLYFFCEPLAEGSFGVIYIAIHALTRRKVAIKILEKHKLGSEAFRVRNEIEALEKLSHQYINKLYHVIETDSCFYLVLEYVPGGELFDYILQKEHLSEVDARVIFRQIVSAIGYIHSRGFAHRDLKPENILLDNDQNVRIIDFGLCAKNSTNNMLNTFCGSLAYAAPEVLANKEYSGSAADLWSMGVILYALLCGCLPFDPMQPGELANKIGKGIFTVPDNLSRSSRHLLAQLICVDPKKRMQMDDLLRHPWMVEGFMGHPVDIDEERIPLSPLNWRIVTEMSFYTRIPKIELARMLLKLPYDYIMATYMVMESTLEEEDVFIHLQRRPRVETSVAVVPAPVLLKGISQAEAHTPAVANQNSCPPNTASSNTAAPMQIWFPPPPSGRVPLAVHSSHNSLPTLPTVSKGDGHESCLKGQPDFVTVKPLCVSKSPNSLGSVSHSNWSDKSGAMLNGDGDTENYTVTLYTPNTKAGDKPEVSGGQMTLSPSRSMDSQLAHANRQDRFNVSVSHDTYSANIASSVSSVNSSLSHELASASLGPDDLSQSHLSSADHHRQLIHHRASGKDTSGSLAASTTTASTGSGISGGGLSIGSRLAATSRLPGFGGGTNWRPFGRLRGVLTPKKMVPDGRLVTEHLRKVRHLNNVILVRKELSPGQVFDQLTATLKAQSIRFTLKGSGFQCIFANDWGKTVLSFELELVYVSTRAVEENSPVNSVTNSIHAPTSIRRRLTIKPRAANVPSKQKPTSPVQESSSLDTSNSSSHIKGQPSASQTSHILGVKIKRLKGDAFTYTSLCRTILDAAEIKEIHTEPSMKVADGE